MAEIVTMPRLSDTMTEGVVAQWLKKVGDTVEEGDILAEIETDKATMEFEAFQSGTLLHIGVQEGETAAVDALLCVLGEQGEDVSALLSGDAPAPAATPAEEAPAAEAPAASAAPAGVSAADLGVEVVTMPRLSDTMTEGTVATWHKKVGDAVEEGDILADIETDKATMEFESFNAGTLLHIGVQEGESTNVDDLLAIIGPAGTDVAALVETLSAGAPIAPAPAAPKATEKVASEKPTTVAAPAPEAKAPVAAAAPVDNSGARIKVSPLARKLAEERGIQLHKVVGTGDHGRIVKRDIENYEPAAAPVAAPSAGPVMMGVEEFEDVKVSQMRKTIARRLSESKFQAPHYYLTLEVDMSNAMESRKAINALPDTKVSFNDMVIKAVALGLKKNPNVNCSWMGDHVRYNKHVNIGVAVAVEDGLLVPVIRHADTKSFTAISAEVKDYAVKAKNKKLQPSDWEGSTFTISNLGMFGIESFTSIINQPDSAILSVGAIVEKPVVKDGQIVVGHTMKVTLACDHRTVDGATGAAFLKTFKEYLENPVTMLA